MTHQAARSVSLTTDPATAFALAVRSACDLSRARIKPWRRDLETHGDHLLCAFCLAPLDPSASPIDYAWLVHPFFGGPIHDSNRLTTCPTCTRSRHAQDVLSWARFSRTGSPASRAALLALRSSQLLFSDNHLTPTSRWSSLDRVHACLAQRHAFPRTRVFAAQGSDFSFIGWTGRCGGRSALGALAAILRFGFSATPIPGHRMILFALPPDRFLDAVWALIEHGALVSRVDVPGFPAQLQDPDDVRAWWPLTFKDPADIRRRRARLAGNSVRVRGTLAHEVARLRAAGQPIPADLSARREAPVAPSPKRSLSTHPTSVRGRRLYRDKVRAQRHQAWLDARASLLDYKDQIKAGKVERPSIHAMALLEQEVMDLYEAIGRWS